MWLNKWMKNKMFSFNKKYFKDCITNILMKDLRNTTFCNTNICVYLKYSF